MILYFDTEATGLWNFKAPIGDPSQPRLCQLAAMLVDDAGVERMRLDVVLYRSHIPDESAKIHGITTQFAQDFGVNEEATLLLFENMVEVADIVVAHNFDYDERVIKNALFHLKRDNYKSFFDGRNRFCTMKASNPICRIPKKSGGGIKFPSLTEAYKFFTGEEFDGAHQAINDVLACKRVFEELQEYVRRAG